MEFLLLRLLLPLLLLSFPLPSLQFALAAAPQAPSSSTTCHSIYSPLNKLTPETPTKPTQPPELRTPKPDTFQQTLEPPLQPIERLLLSQTGTLQTFLATLHDEDVIITPYTHHSRPAGATSRHVGIGLSHKTLYQARSLVTPLSARCSALIKRDLGLGQMLSQLPSPPSLRILSYGRRSTRHAPLVSAEFEGVEESLKKLTLDERYDGGLYREYKLENEDVCIFIREDFTLDTIKVGE